MPGEPGPEDWQPTLAQTQADRHQACEACAASSKTQPQILSVPIRQRSARVFIFKNPTEDLSREKMGLAQVS